MSQVLDNEKRLVSDKKSVRKLTPLECERLQGLPDNWTLVDGISDLARYRATGNAMAQPVANYVLKRLKEEANASDRI